MSLIGSITPVLCWALYAFLLPRLEHYRPSLSSLMNVQRRRWIAHAVSRDNPLDGILSSNLMSSIAFFASSTVLMILALFAVFGQLPAIREVLMQIRPEYVFSTYELEIHMVAILVLFIMAFLSFTLSLRQFNHFCIMLGAIQNNEDVSVRDIDIVTFLNGVGAKNFNLGIRAYYFSTAMLVWFVSPLAAIAMSGFVMLFLIHGEFFSTARRLVADLSNQ